MQTWKDKVAYLRKLLGREPLLDELIEEARKHVMTPEEKEEQRKSLVRGLLPFDWGLGNSSMTKVMEDDIGKPITITIDDAGQVGLIVRDNGSWTWLSVQEARDLSTLLNNEANRAEIVLVQKKRLLLGQYRQMAEDLEKELGELGWEVIGSGTE